jgi:hypothetical protein
MRAHVSIPGRGRIPINMYLFNLAASGAGKGHSMTIMEDRVVNQFREVFLEHTFPTMAQKHVEIRGRNHAMQHQMDEKDGIKIMQREYQDAGPYLDSFDSGTVAAIKQMRHKLLLAQLGSMSLIMDEVGSNMLGNMDVLTAYLELFDMGKIKTKLTKNTRDNIRNSNMTGATPTNMLLFGTPVKLLDDPKVVEEFMTMLEIGFARRSFFGLNTAVTSIAERTPEEVLDLLENPANETILETLSLKYRALANPNNIDETLKMTEEVQLAWLAYRIQCEKEAENINEYQEIRKSELKHSHFKVAKLAGAYAFVNNSMLITMEHLESAIALAEESREALNRILNRDKPYVKLAEYICSIQKELTHADLVEDLPFYKGSENQKRDMLKLAIAYGYKNGMVIKRDLVDDIEFFSGSSLEQTDLEHVTLSYSTHYTQDYQNKEINFRALHKLCARPGYHWVNHALRPNPEKGARDRGYRCETHVVPGFNLVVVDVDGGISIGIAKELLKDYVYFMHTTKSHTEQEHRFRIVFPLSHRLYLKTEDFKEFMRNIYLWLPFNVDEQTYQRSRKWATAQGTYWYNSDGELLDAIQFIPKTKKAEEQKSRITKTTDLGRLERWFLEQMNQGQRNNMLHRYAMVLIDSGHTTEEIENAILGLNKRCDHPLSVSEIENTVLKSVHSKTAGTNP